MLPMMRLSRHPRQRPQQLESELEPGRLSELEVTTLLPPMASRRSHLRREGKTGQFLPLIESEPMVFLPLVHSPSKRPRVDRHALQPTPRCWTQAPILVAAFQVRVHASVAQI